MIIVTPVMGISRPVFLMMQVGPWFIEHYFITSVQIVVPASFRKLTGKNPPARIEINKLMPGNIIVGFDIR
jgi:hypothetical protein